MAIYAIGATAALIYVSKKLAVARSIGPQNQDAATTNPTLGSQPRISIGASSDPASPKNDRTESGRAGAGNSSNKAGSKQTPATLAASAAMKRLEEAEATRGTTTTNPFLEATSAWND